MVARKRKAGESFKAYRANLKSEQKWLTGRLLGEWFHQLKINPKTGKPEPFRRSQGLSTN
jgi:hypothetical protein